MIGDQDFAPLTFAWRLAPDVSFMPRSETGLDLAVAGQALATLALPTSRVLDALYALVDGASEGRLLHLAGASAGPVLYSYIMRLVRHRLLEACAARHGAPIARLVPRRRDFDLPRPGVMAQRVTLDRFALLRRTPRGAVLQSPEASCDLIIEDPACSVVVARLAAGPIEIARLTDATDRALVLMLAALGFAANLEETERPARRVWEFHDRLFHRASRSYDDGVARGGTYRFRTTLPAPPAIRVPHQGEVVELRSPSADRLGRSRSLYAVMEDRRSERAMAAQPLSLEDVAEVLYRVARVTAVIPGGDVPQDCLLRPFPSSGSIHEIEFYLAVRDCAGLRPGFYHYRGREHALTHLARAGGPAAAMLANCAASWGQPGQPPHVLVVIASRLPCLAWKYEGTAYAASMLNAGVALQSLYLVTADLGLAGCAVVAGDPELFASATGVDTWEETNIVGFGFGRRP